MIEKNLRKCKVCNEVKEQIFVGKFDAKNKKFVDQTGGTWNGRTCPACHNAKVKTDMTTLRFKRAQTNG